MMGDGRAVKPIAGRHVLLALIGFFGLMLIANGFFVYFALATFSGGDTSDLSLAKIISGRVGGAVQPGLESRGWRQSVGLLDVTADLSVMPSASALDCNTPHMRKEFAAGASR
jgi:hypothetical protein